MSWMLQPHNYIQIGKPNLYNVSYRRVGAYKGMGRFNPTNYLDIGNQPNRIGGTTGQYSTLSGQLSLYPPSLRGLGFTYPGSGVPTVDVRQPGSILPWYRIDPNKPWYQNTGLLAAIAAGLVVVLAARRR